MIVPKISMVGRRVGHLLVLRRDESRPDDIYWWCRCDCGREKSIWGGNLRRKKRAVSSCGCINPRSSTHGGSKGPEYEAWRAIKRRCNNPNDAAYAYYGGRGIHIADEWQNDYPRFLAHVGRRPSSEHSIDRIDNDRGYEPGNVRWATKVQQMNNRRNTRFVTTPDGDVMPASEAAIAFGVKRHTLSHRLQSGFQGAALVGPVGETIRRGEAHSRAKLTTEDVLEIRRRLRTGELQRSIALTYGVDPTAVSLIKRGVNWKHVQGETP